MNLHIWIGSIHYNIVFSSFKSHSVTFGLKGCRSPSKKPKVLHRGKSQRSLCRRIPFGTVFVVVKNICFIFCNNFISHNMEIQAEKTKVNSCSEAHKQMNVFFIIAFFPIEVIGIQWQAKYCIKVYAACIQRKNYFFLCRIGNGNFLNSIPWNVYQTNLESINIIDADIHKSGLQTINRVSNIKDWWPLNAFNFTACNVEKSSTLDTMNVSLKYIEKTGPLHSIHRVACNVENTCPLNSFKLSGTKVSDTCTLAVLYRFCYVNASCTLCSKNFSRIIYDTWSLCTVQFLSSIEHVWNLSTVYYSCLVHSYGNHGTIGPVRLGPQKSKR